MKTKLHQTLNYCGYYTGLKIRVTTNTLGKIWVEPIGWNPHKKGSWLGLPYSPKGCIGKEV